PLADAGPPRRRADRLHARRVIVEPWGQTREEAAARRHGGGSDHAIAVGFAHGPHGIELNLIAAELNGCAAPHVPLLLAAERRRPGDAAGDPQTPRVGAAPPTPA